MIIIFSCTKENREDLQPLVLNNNNNTTTPLPVASCDTSNITYATYVNPLMMSSCGTIGCHSGSFPAASVSLDTYTDVKYYVDNGQLMGTIKHQTGYKPMPQGASKLSDCDIAKLEAWISAGAQNN